MAIMSTACQMCKFTAAGPFMDRGTTNRMPLILMLLRGSRFLASMTYCRGAVDIVLSHVLNSSASQEEGCSRLPNATTTTTTKNSCYHYSLSHSHDYCYFFSHYQRF